MTRDEEVKEKWMEKWRAYLVAERQSARATKANRGKLEQATHKAWLSYCEAKFPTQEWGRRDDKGRI